MIKNRLNLRNVAKMIVAGLTGFKNSAMLVGAVVISAMLMFTSCKENVTNNSTDPEEPEPVIEEPITATTVKVAVDKETTIGNLNEDGYQVIIPAGAFDTEVNISITNSDKEVENAYKNSSEFICLSSPISITVEGKEGETVWLKKLATISFPLQAGTAVDPNDYYRIFGSFYNPDTKSVDYIYPDWNDLQKGIITFTTGHFSDPVAIFTKEDKAIAKFAKDEAGNWLEEEKQKVSPETNALLTDVYNEVYDKMGITDESLKGILVTGALKETDFGALAAAVREGDLGAITGKASEMAANYLFNKMKLDPSVNAAMVNVQTATITGAVNAIAHAVNGDYKEAAKAISQAFLEYTFPPAKFVPLANQLISYSIASWCDYQLQYAYNLFESKGYTGKIPDDEWTMQSTKASLDAYIRELKIEAINSYCKINGVSESEVGEAALNQIRAKTESDLRKMLEGRLEATAKAKQKEAEYLDIIKHFKDDDLLDYFDYDIPIELRLKRLFLVRETILNTVGGPLVHPNGLRTSEECLREATFYYVRVFVYERGGKTMKPGGKQDFIDWLISEGYIEEKKQEIVWVLTNSIRQDGGSGPRDPNDYRFNFRLTYTSLESSFSGTCEFLGDYYVNSSGMGTISAAQHEKYHGNAECNCSLTPLEKYTASCEFSSVPKTIRLGDVVNFSVSISVKDYRKESTFAYIPAMTAALRSSSNWNISRATFAQVVPRNGRIDASNSLSLTFTKAYFPAVENEQASIIYEFGTAGSSNNATTTYIYKSVKQ